jgi:hypothetical protein
MGYGIPSEEMAAISLILVDGHVEANMLEVIRRAEAYQRTQDSCFGVTDLDFRHSLMWLAVYTDLWTWQTILQAESDDASFADHTLREFLPRMLRYSALYCNDEGEAWYGETLPPCEARLRLQAFLAGPPGVEPAGVMAFLAAQGWDSDLLRRSLECNVWAR